MKPGMAKALMIQGTCSNAGKSLLVAGLARAYTRRGMRVRPFKPQNMSNNAAVTADGGEIGRAQALQARACGIEPLTDMNPVLLKPQSETGAQVVVQGRVLGSCSARDYHALKPQLLPRVLESFGRLRAGADLVLVEGAGSPAEVNLRAGDIANMGFARAADVPVVLAGDIERGGVIAQLVGTVLLLEPEERALLVGYVVNKFRGDPALFDDAHPWIEARTGLRSLGVVTWLERARDLPKEDILGLAELAAAGRARVDRPIRVAVPRLPRLANFDEDWRCPRRGTGRRDRGRARGRAGCAGAGRPTAPRPCRRSGSDRPSASCMMSSWIRASRAACSTLRLVEPGIEEGDIVGERAGQQMIVLHHRADPAAPGGRASPGRAARRRPAILPRGRRQQAEQDAHQGRLARARRADDGDEAAGRDLEVELVEDRRLGRAVGEAQPLGRIAGAGSRLAARRQPQLLPLLADDVRQALEMERRAGATSGTARPARSRSTVKLVR